MSDKEYRIVVPVDGSFTSKNAIKYAARLCSQLSTPYQLEIIYAVGLNPPGNSLLSGLDRMNNVEILEDAKVIIADINDYIHELENIVTMNEVIVIEGEEEVGVIIEDYINKQPPDQLVMGSSGKEGLQKFIMGSVSDYCLHKCKCPVTLLRNNI